MDQSTDRRHLSFSEERDRRLLRQRLRLGLLFASGAIGLLMAGDAWDYASTGRPPHFSHLFQLAALLSGLILLPTAFGQEHPARVGLLAYGGVSVATAALGIETGEPLPGAILLVTLTTGVGAFLPWGVRSQTALVVLVGTSLLASFMVSASLIEGSLSTHTVTIGVALLATIFMTRQAQLQGAERHQAEQGRRAKAEEIGAINRATTRYLESGDIGRSAAILLEAAVRLTESRFGTLVVSDEAGKPAPPVAENFALASLPESDDALELAAKLLHTGEAFRDKHDDPRPGTPMMGVPIRIGPTTLGALVVAGNPAAYRRDDQLHCESLSQAAGILVDSARAHQHTEEEHAVSEGLAEVGRAVLADIGTPTLLQRVCELTTKILGCDMSHTLLFDPEDETYVPIAGYGDEPEKWEEIRVLRLPQEMFANILSGMGEGRAVTVDPTPDLERNRKPRRLAREHGISRTMFVPLRRGDAIVGLHMASLRQRESDFDARQRRIFEGIGRLASMALHNTRLLEELEAANRTRSEFVATMSHELRTPLNVVIGYGEMLLDGAYGPLNDDQRASLLSIERNARELHELITATLDLSRLEAGRLQLQVQPIDLGEFLEPLIEELRPAARDGVAFRAESRLAEPIVETDALKLKVVLKNLVRNALKFTHEGEVTLTVDRTEDDLVFRVRDTGIGIDEEAQRVIFDAFRQAGPHESSKYGGVGLGLYIVRRMLDQLDGRIELESELGKGSTFSVFLPMAAPVRAASATA